MVEAVISLCPKVKNAHVFMQRKGAGGCGARESVLKIKNAWPNVCTLCFYSLYSVLTFHCKCISSCKVCTSATVEYLQFCNHYWDVSGRGC